MDVLETSQARRPFDDTQRLRPLRTESQKGPRGKRTPVRAATRPGSRANAGLRWSHLNVNYRSAGTLSCHETPNRSVSQANFFAKGY